MKVTGESPSQEKSRLTNLWNKIVLPTIEILYCGKLFLPLLARHFIRSVEHIQLQNKGFTTTKLRYRLQGHPYFFDYRISATGVSIFDVFLHNIDQERADDMIWRDTKYPISLCNSLLVEYLRQMDKITTGTTSNRSPSAWGVTASNVIVPAIERYNLTLPLKIHQECYTNWKLCRGDVNHSIWYKFVKSLPEIRQEPAGV